MPEEQAFCVLVKLMYDYGLRDLYKDRFDNLHMRFYQLNRLMEEQLPELYKHFCDRGVETHMFAAQWFLTLFTARFPLYLVFHILDVFLLQGLDTLFQVALALLMVMVLLYIFESPSLSNLYVNSLRMYNTYIPNQKFNSIRVSLLRNTTNILLKMLKTIILHNNNAETL